jgi:predicted transcriptional regulator
MFEEETMNPKPESDLVRQSLWLAPETLEALKKIGQKQDRPVGWLIRKACEEFVARELKEKSR